MTTTKLYKSQLVQLQDIFPDWTESDLVALLDEVSGDVTLAISRISEGHAQQWEVQSGKKKTVKKPAEPEQDRNKPSGRGRGSFRGRGRGGGRGRGRGGANRSSRPAPSYQNEVQANETWSAEPDANVSAEWGMIPMTDSSANGGWDVSDAPASVAIDANDAAQSFEFDASESQNQFSDAQKQESSSFDWGDPVSNSSIPEKKAETYTKQEKPKSNSKSGTRSESKKPSSTPSGKTSWAQLVKASIQPKPEPEPPKPVEAPVKSAPPSPKKESKAPSRSASPVRQPQSPKKEDVILPKSESVSSPAPVSNEVEQESKPVERKPVAASVTAPAVSSLPPGLKPASASPAVVKTTPASSLQSKKPKQDAPVVMPSSTPMSGLDVQFGSLKLGKVAPVGTESEAASSYETSAEKTSQRLASPVQPVTSLSSAPASASKPSTVQPVAALAGETNVPSVSSAPGLASGAPGLTNGLLPYGSYFPPHQQTPFGVAPIGGHVPQDFSALYQPTDATGRGPLGYYDPSAYSTSAAPVGSAAAKFSDSSLSQSNNNSVPSAQTGSHASSSTLGSQPGQPQQAASLNLGPSAGGVPQLNPSQAPQQPGYHPLPYGYYHPYYMNQFQSAYQNPSMYGQQFMNKSVYGGGFQAQPSASAGGPTGTTNASVPQAGGVANAASQKTGLLPGSNNSPAGLTGAMNPTNTTPANPSLGYPYGAPAGQPSFYQGGAIPGYDDLTSSLASTGSTHDYKSMQNSYGQQGVFGGGSQFGNKGGSDYKNRQNNRHSSYDKYASNSSNNTMQGGNGQVGNQSSTSGASHQPQQGQNQQAYYNQHAYGYPQHMMHPQQYGSNNMGYGAPTGQRQQYWSGPN